MLMMLRHGADCVLGAYGHQQDLDKIHLRLNQNQIQFRMRLILGWNQTGRQVILKNQGALQHFPPMRVFYLQVCVESSTFLPHSGQKIKQNGNLPYCFAINCLLIYQCNVQEWLILFLSELAVIQTCFHLKTQYMLVSEKSALFGHLRS